MPAVTSLPCLPDVAHALGLCPALVRNVPLSLRVTRKVPSLFFLTVHVRMLVSVAHTFCCQVPWSGTTTRAEKRLCPPLAFPFPPGSARLAVASAKTPASRRTGTTIRRIRNSPLRLLFWQMPAGRRSCGALGAFERPDHDVLAPRVVHPGIVLGQLHRGRRDQVDPR